MGRSGLQSIRRCAFLALAGMLALAASAMVEAAGQNDANTVRLVVDYGDGTTKTIDNLAWAKGNTVFDAMKAAAARPHGISFSYTGSGDTTMITRIDGVANQGSGAGKKNWQYWVNQAYGDRSFAVFELHAHDVVQWRYTTEQGQ